MARKMAISYDNENGTVTFTPNDESVSGVTLNVNDYPQNIVTYAALFGLGTVGQNAYAGIDEPAGMIEAIVARDAAMKTGDWKTRGAGAGAKLTQFFQDLVTVTGNTPENLIPWFKALSDVEQDQIRKSPDIAAAKTARVKLAADKAAKAAKAKAADAPATDLFAGIAG